MFIFSSILALTRESKYFPLANHMKDTPYPSLSLHRGSLASFTPSGLPAPLPAWTVRGFQVGSPSVCLPAVCPFSSGQSLFPQETYTMQGSLRISSLFSFLSWRGKNGDEPNAIWSQSNQFRTQVRAQFLVTLLSLSKQFCMANRCIGEWKCGSIVLLN